MINVVESVHATAIFAYLPRGKEIAMEGTETEDESYMLSICRPNEKAKCFSVRPYFTVRIAQGERFKSGGHWDPAGHKVVAEAIKDYLVNESYISMPQSIGTFSRSSRAWQLTENR